MKFKEYIILYIYLNLDRLSKIVGKFWESFGGFLGISAQPLVDFGQLFVDFIKRALDFSPFRVDF